MAFETTNAISPVLIFEIVWIAKLGQFVSYILYNMTLADVLRVFNYHGFGGLDPPPPLLLPPLLLLLPLTPPPLLFPGIIGGLKAIAINVVVVYYLYRPNVKAYFGKAHPPEIK